MSQPSIGHRILNMVQDSIILQSLITLVLVSTICYLTIVERNVPKEVWTLTGGVVGYWFGAKADYNVTKRVDSIKALVVRDE